MTLLNRPAVVSFYADHGRDLSSTPHRELAWVMTDEGLTVRWRDPWEIELRVQCGDETLVAVVDGDLADVETRRE